MPARLFLSSGDLMADRRFEFRARSAIEGRSGRRRRSAAAGDRAGAELSPPPGSRSAKSANSSASTRRRSRRFARRTASDPGDRHGAGLRLMRLGADAVAACRRPMCRHCSINMRRGSDRRWSDDLGYRGPALLFSGGAVGARRRPASRPSSSAPSISAAAPGLLPRAFASEVDAFHRHRSVAAHDRAGARHRALCASSKSPTCCKVCAPGRTPARISFLPRTRWSMSPICRRLLAEAQPRAGVRRLAGVHRAKRHGGRGRHALGAGLRVCAQQLATCAPLDRAKPGLTLSQRL